MLVLRVHRGFPHQHDQKERLSLATGDQKSENGLRPTEDLQWVPPEPPHLSQLRSVGFLQSVC